MKKGLASWFAIWHPRYRAILVQLLLAGAVASGLVYVQNSLLGLLTESLVLAEQPGEPGTSPAAGPRGGLAVLSGVASSGWISLPFLVLGLFILTRAVAAAVEFWKTYATGKLTIRTKDDMETEILTRLLRKDDAFFSRHSPAETVNRLAIDLFRVSARRPNLMQLCWSALLIVGNFVFFLSKDWRLAMVALAGCLAGAFWTRGMTRHVKQIDSDYLQQDDQVKSRFEDLLRAAPEVQVGGLYEKIRRRFRKLLGHRSRTFLRYVRMNSSLTVGSVLCYLLTFVVMVLVVVHQRASPATSHALAMLPVVIWALPGLFANASLLIHTNVQFQLARTSMDRLLEYESEGSLAPDRRGPAAEALPAEPARGEGVSAGLPSARAFTLENVSYRYTGPEGALQGGIAGISTTFRPGQWTAIVGGAGSGKSTILKLLLGRLKPQGGRILYGKAALGSPGGDQPASVLSVMPQSLALLNASIRENLLFGRSPGDGGAPASSSQLTEADLDVVERVGLGRICRQKALDMIPGGGANCAAVGDSTAEMRRSVRRCAEDRCGARVLPYEEGHFDPRHWVLEWLLGGKCERRQAAQILRGKRAAARLRSLGGTTLGAELATCGREVLCETRRLLGLESYHVYAQLAPTPIDEGVWRLRSGNVGLAEKQSLSGREVAALCGIALTSAPAELGDDGRARDWHRLGAAPDFAAVIADLRDLLGPAWRGFALNEVNPHLTWRENLLFGVVDASNSRAGQLAAEALLDFLEQDGLRQAFTEIGLEFEIGRLGGNLSGGQGQLVGLCRALLRRTPVLILDEPTSSLDPASRARVADCLRTWRAGRIIITVSHDPDLIREADEIKVLESGRLVAAGSFEQLQETSEVFRRTLKVR